MSQFYVSVKLSVSVLRECETVCLSFMCVRNCVSQFYVSVKLSVSILRECETVCLSFM